ncbi:MAG: hypothetical protein DWB42_12685 [Chloroflexi bacterium]|nr:hypothetical protein [Chloroflexota bacterium]MDL1883155.1 hypothetical protein [Anaerolineae bacterium CFX8]
MPDYQQFFIDKTPKSFGDALLLHGFARLLENFGVDPSGIVISDRGSYFSVDLATPIGNEQIDEAAKTVQLIPYIKTAKNALPYDDLRYVDYEAEKAQSAAFFEARKSGGEASPPSPEWSIYRAINPGAIQGYNNLARAWYIARSRETLYLLFDLFSATPNDIDGAMSAWKALDKAKGWGIKASATALQLFNPDSGKGHNKVKGDGLSIGNLDSFWLLEYLKAAGFYVGAITRTLRESKDRKTLVVVPRQLTLSENLTVMGKFAESMQVPLYPTQFDILAVIRYTHALIKHAIAAPRGRYALDRSQVKQRVVAGFQTAFYKDMGNSAATMNMSFLGLPGWVAVASQTDVNLYIHPETGLLVEFEKFVRQFNEKESDVPELLRPLRDFVSGDDLEVFFEFTNAFPGYLIGRRSRRKPAKALSTQFIERIIMSQNDPILSNILDSPGFRDVAYAIRKSTVIAQWSTEDARKKGKRYPYEIRYGLHQTLLRRAARKQEFIADLSAFLTQYQAETVQIEETMSKRNVPFPFEYQRRSIRTTALEEIVALIDEYGSEPVANLLIAYGYARLPRQVDDSTDETPLEPDEAFEGEE